MMAATSENDIDLDLRLYLNSGDERILLGEDVSEGAFPYIVMDVFDAVTLEVEVSSARTRGICQHLCLSCHRSRRCRRQRQVSKSMIWS